MLAQQSVQSFLDELQSNSPAPGGGSVAALNGAIAAALVGMVANLTLGKKKYADVAPEMETIAKKMDELKNVFIAFIDKDANSFNGVIAAFKMPKESDEDKAKRTEAIQAGYREAIAVPLAVAKSAAELFDVIENVLDKGNSQAASDALVAAISTRTAIISALLNVEINLAAVKDEDYVKRLTEEVENLKVIANQREQDILSKKTF